MTIPSWIRWRSVLVLLLLLQGCATTVSRLQVNDSARPEPRAAWQQVLERHVDNEGRVAFSRLTQDRAALDEYVAWINAVSPESQPERFSTPAGVLAYHLNAYNALAMHAVLEKGIPETFAGFRKVQFFYFSKVQVGGAPISLYAYENKVIRALNEPRIHFALNCMSVSCPTLPRTPFDAITLEAQLQRETRRFMNDPRHVRTDEATRTAYLSEIFSFFTSDFLAVAPSLLDYVNRYRDSPIPIPSDYSVRFIPYDWTVNRQPQ
jgi:hypothetical protein